MVMVAVALVSCHRPRVLCSLVGLGGGRIFQSLVIFMFIDSGPETAWSKAPFIWNLGQCLDLWVEEI